MGRYVRALTAAALISIGQQVLAETYKCSRDGKTFYSDAPCAAKAARVDEPSDKVGRYQQQQARAVHLSNRRQLSELETQASHGRYYIPSEVVTLRRR